MQKLSGETVFSALCMLIAKIVLEMPLALIDDGCISLLPNRVGASVPALVETLRSGNRSAFCVRNNFLGAFKLVVQRTLEFLFHIVRCFQNLRGAKEIQRFETSDIRPQQ